MNLDSGRHVAINIRTETQKDLQNIQHVHKLFDHVIKAIDMNVLVSPQSHLIPASTQNVNHPTADDGGLTTFCIIDTSHIAYHSWPLQRRFRFTVDSCKDFNPSRILRILDQFFDIQAISVVGSRYVPPIDLPKSITVSLQLRLGLPFTQALSQQ